MTSTHVASLATPRPVNLTSCSKYTNEVNPFDIALPSQAASGSRKRKFSSEHGGDVRRSKLRATSRHKQTLSVIPGPRLPKVRIVRTESGYRAFPVAEPDVDLELPSARRHTKRGVQQLQRSTALERTIAPIRIIRTPQGYEVVRSTSNTPDDGPRSPYISKLRIIRTKDGVYKACPSTPSTPDESSIPLPN